MSEGIAYSAFSLGALNAAQDIPVDGYEVLALDVSGTFTATFTLTATVDGVNFRALAFTTPGLAAINTSGQSGSTQLLVANVSGIKSVRVQLTAYTSGTAVFTAAIDNGPMPPAINVGNNPAISTAAVPSASQTSPFTRHRVLSAASTNATSVKASAGNIHYLAVANDGGTKAFLKLYDKASAPNPASDTPVMTILLPVGSQQVIVNEALLRHPFSLGIAYLIVGLIADTDATGVAAAQVAMTMLYA